MGSKTEILRILKSNLSQAEDNLCRAEWQFKRIPLEQLDREWGKSGQTCSDILKSYRAEMALAKKCLAAIDL